MEVEAAQVAGYVHDFADEVQPRDLAALHGLAGEFAGVDAAGCDFGLLVAFSAFRSYLPMVRVTL